MLSTITTVQKIANCLCKLLGLNGNYEYTKTINNNRYAPIDISTLCSHIVLDIIHICLHVLAIQLNVILGIYLITFDHGKLRCFIIIKKLYFLLFTNSYFIDVLGHNYGK